MYATMVVANQSGSLSFFPIDASGDVAPTKTIAGPMTGLDNPYGVAYLPTTQQIFVADRDAYKIDVFNRTDTGMTTAKRTLAGTSTGLGEPASLVLVP